MGLFTNRRKIQGIVIDSRALLRFAIPFFALIVTSVSAILILHWQMMSALMQVQAVADFDIATSASVASTVAQVTETGVVEMFILGVLCLGFFIIYSHRIFGPMVPFRRHVQSLMDGKYESRIQLRRRDEFKELAEDLNRLAEKLGSGK